MRLNIILFSGQSIDSLSTNQLLLLSHRTQLILVFVVELYRSQIEICKYAMIVAMIGFTISETMIVIAQESQLNGNSSHNV